ncbi:MULTISPECIES: hypothetical protein [unclassified Tolypothrix]|uniref:hypothetical protein n=1 Tax=unclassified Tolypothrix TaxID=2649714 RepID=UPI0005EAA855|nr:MULTISPECIES: hypothetical protein [unclassified Tolypothrix]BAY92119.1 hypothetical protein NIES3275_41510 [Microchaete diplosiphon NIES-3275]EKF04663.1 hypothetical protein FDUTEX481_00820 [Tolypothrix sp. PCC 7601]MBE9084384.1 hypothetical protein [Tolypothrix sp. LEGE 11397]UYD26101.1 hypothetical protein HGR01_33155 [Tolypothrix sp. PCC 7712]UYD31660.1 hypothetical protein HG267_21370 [Tolypothrix sp. PCC 7601]
MSKQIPDQLIAFPIVPFFLGGCLALLPDSTTPVQAQTPQGSFLIAERTVVNTLPPPPAFQTIPYNQPQVTTQPTPWNTYNPKFQPSSKVRVNKYNQTYRSYQTVQATSYSWSAERYIVYVEGNDSQQLQRIRQLERSAYIRHFNGRAVIQSGAFSRQTNAQQRVRELELSGINGAKIVKSNGQQVAGFSSGTGRRGPSRQEQTNYYYVTIPARAQDLSSIASRIRQNSGRYDIVVERQEPLGPHVAVGPFAERSDAERWNDYLRELGFGNARVYYGR